MTQGPDARFGRTELLVGAEGLRRLAEAHVAIFGLGGVGSYAVEAIARAGVGHIRLVDFDTLEPSNLNRQLFALESTLGRPKVDVARERIADIHSKARVEAIRAFADAENLDELLAGMDYVIDAIDTVHAKVALLTAAHQRGLPVVSCMGAANKLLPTDIRVADIRDTEYCPLARVIRQRLRKAGIETAIRCVYSTENRGIVEDTAENPEGLRKTRIQGSIAYVPGIIGLTAAGLVVSDMLQAGAPPGRKK